MTGNLAEQVVDAIGGHENAGQVERVLSKSTQPSSVEPILGLGHGAVAAPPAGRRSCCSMACRREKATALGSSLTLLVNLLAAGAIGEAAHGRFATQA